MTTLKRKRTRRVRIAYVLTGIAVGAPLLVSAWDRPWLIGGAFVTLCAAAAVLSIAARRHTL